MATLPDIGNQDEGLKLSSISKKNNTIVIENELVPKDMLNRNDIQNSKEAVATQERPSHIDLVTPEPDPKKFVFNGTESKDGGENIVVPSNEDRLNNDVEMVKGSQKEGLPDYVLCTACNKKLNIKKRKICKHPKLGVLICKTCLKFINSNEFTRDEMGIEEFCTWCGDGGNLVCCDFCEKAYCKHCVRNNMGKEFLKALLDAEDDVKWKCFSCDQEQLQSFTKECDAIMTYIDELKQSDRMYVERTTSSGLTQSERKKRLSAVEKQVSLRPEVHMQHESSFKDNAIEDTQSATSMEDGQCSENTEMKSDVENKDSGNDGTKKMFFLKADKVRPVVPMLGSNDVSDIITKIRSDNVAAARHRRKSVPVSYNEKELQKTAEKNAEKKLEVLEKCVKQKPKKKRTIIMISSESEDGDDEIVVVSKSGKRRVLSKHMLLAAQAALRQKDEKKDSDNEQGVKVKIGKRKLSDFMRVKLDGNPKNSESTDGSSVDKSESDSDSEGESDSEVASLTEKPAPKSTLDENGYRIVVDGQQPGPSGVRPKNKMQIRRQQLERKRKMSCSSDSESDDTSGNHRMAKKRLNCGLSPNDDIATEREEYADTTLQAPSLESDPIENKVTSDTDALEIPTASLKVETDTNTSKAESPSYGDSEKGESLLTNKTGDELNECTDSNMTLNDPKSNVTPVLEQNDQEGTGDNSSDSNKEGTGDNSSDSNKSTNELNLEENKDVVKGDGQLKDDAKLDDDLKEHTEDPEEGSGNDLCMDEIEAPAEVGKSKSKSTSISSSDSDSHVEVSRKKSRLKKRRKRVRLASNTSEEDVLSSDNEDGDDDVANVLSDTSSDSSSSDGSVIVTRKSKRQATQKKKRNPIGRKKGRKKKGEDGANEMDDDDIQSPNKGRKKIRRILKDHELNEETIHARELEEQRRKRLLERTQADRQEKYHVVLEEEGDLVLERNDKKEVLCSVDTELNAHLKPHQRKGVQFMYDCIIETVSSYKKGDDGGGCLLAHCMGLGKTLQVVVFVHTLMNCENIRMKRFLVVAPLNTVLNWEQEFEKWLNVDQRIDVSVLSTCNDNKERIQMIRDWYEEGGVIIAGYEMYRNLVNCTYLKGKKMKEDVKKCFVDPGPECVICDEGHVLRNDTSAISKAMNAIKTKRRIVLTGTPLQNNLPEYHVMVDFVKPKLLGTRKEFLNRFVNPIHNGQCSNSTPRDVKVMKQRAHVLFQVLSGCVQRQDYSVLSPFLPQKREYTIFVRLTEKQIKMYKYYIENFVYKDGNNKLKGSSLFSDFQCLARIWTHPWSLQIERERQAFRNRYKEDNSMDEFIDDDGDDESASSENDEGGDKRRPWTIDTSSDDEKASKRRKSRKAAVDDSNSSSDSESENENKPKTQLTVPARTTRSSTQNEQRPSDENEDTKKQSPKKIPGSLRSGSNFKDSSLNPREDEKPAYEKEWYDEFVTEEDEHNAELSGKLILMLEILANAEVVGDKVLIFSQSLTSLDLIESTLGGGEIGGNQLNWYHGVDYFRMDGSTPVQKRKRWADIFNDSENDRCRLFLISTKSGSLGINMVAANRVIIFDCSWNPSHDVQSVFRVYRFGQEKPVYVYRFIAQGSMEEKIYGRQINKLAVSGRVVDEMQIERHFTDEEIRDLYTFAPEPIKEGETPQLPKDPLLAEVLQRQHPKYIARYHEHDLLLENIEGEELSEEERKQAWKSYEEEKENAARGIRMDFRSGMYNGQFPGVSNLPPNMAFNNMANNIIRVPPIPDNIPPEERARLEMERSQKIQRALMEIRARQMQTSVGRFNPVIPSNIYVRQLGNQPIVTPSKTVSVTDNSHLLKMLPSMSARGVVNIPGLGDCRVMPVVRNPNPGSTPFSRTAAATLQNQNSNVGPTQSQQSVNISTTKPVTRPSKYDIPKDWK